MTVEMEKQNNKELVPLEHYLEAYGAADPAEMSERTHFPYDPEKKVFHTIYLGRPYTVSWPDFVIEAEDACEDYSPLLSTNQSKILMVRFLTEGSCVAPSGNYLTYREVPWGEVYYRQFSGRCLTRLAMTYGRRIEDYSRRMEHLGAKPVDKSDAGFAYEIFPGYTVQFLMWAGDDEFPPSAQILFSDNFAAAFHPEDLVVVSELVISALKFL